jgi:hypothetical protein
VAFVLLWLEPDKVIHAVPLVALLPVSGVPVTAQAQKPLSRRVNEGLIATSVLCLNFFDWLYVA